MGGVAGNFEFEKRRAGFRCRGQDVREDEVKPASIATVEIAEAQFRYAVFLLLIREILTFRPRRRDA